MTSRYFHWINVLLIVASAGVILIGVFAVRANWHVTEVEAGLAQGGRIRSDLLQTLSAMRDAETGQRGYLLTGDESYLEPYYVGINQAEEQDRVLAQFAQEGDLPVGQVTELSQLVAKRRSQLEEAITLRRDDTGGNGFETARNVVLTKGGKATMDQIRLLVENLTAEQDELQRQREQDLSDLNATRMVVVALAQLLTLSTFLAAAVFTNLERNDRQRSNRDLLNERARLKAIVDSNMDAVLVLDEAARILFVNPAAEDIFGCRDCDQAGQPVSTLFPERFHASLMDQFRRFASSDRLREPLFSGTTMSGRHADGREFPAEAVISKSTTEGSKLFTVMLRDVSEREEGRKQIREFGTVLEQVRDAIHIRDLEDRIQFWNMGAEQLYGWTADEAIGKPATEFIHSSSDDDVESIVAILQSEGAWSGEQEITTQAGQHLIIESRRSMIVDERGLPISQLVIDVDVTDEKRRRREQQRSQRLESIGTLASGIAHDLNNVLTPITMGAGLLSRVPDRPDRDELIKSISTSAGRGAAMVRQLLSFAGGGATIKREQVPVAPIIEETVGILQHTFPKNIEITADVDPRLATVQGDETELSQLLMNLSINARDAMPDGGRLSFEATNVQLNGDRPSSAGDLPAGDYVQLVVSDTGIGIPEEAIERVFDPFFTTKELGKGTGLGLATCMGIVKSHGGNITVYSEPVSGTRFTIYLPCQTCEANVDAVVESEDTESSAGEILLLIDDEEAILSVASATLRAAGYDVVTSSGGESGVKQFREDPHRFALAIVDLMMPHMDGAETIRALHEIRPELPIITCSGLAKPNEQDGTMTASKAFLSKPYDDRILLQTVRRVIDDARSASDPSAEPRPLMAVGSRSSEET